MKQFKKTKMFGAEMKVITDEKKRGNPLYSAQIPSSLAVWTKFETFYVQTLFCDLWV